MAVFISDTAKGGTRRLPTAGKYSVPFDVEIPTTALDSTDEQVLLLQFGPDTYWSGQSVNDFVIDTDTLDGGSTLVFTIGFSDIDGVIDVTVDDGTALIAGSTAGQSGALDFLDEINDDILPMVDISGKYLCLDVTTAATTPAAGGVKGYIVVDSINFSNDKSLE